MHFPASVSVFTFRLILAADLAPVAVVPRGVCGHATPIAIATLPFDAEQSPGRIKSPLAERIIKLRPSLAQKTSPSPLFEIARVLVRCDHIASVIVNADRGITAKPLRCPTKGLGPRSNIGENSGGVISIVLAEPHLGRSMVWLALGRSL
jgi:hypothetical protein